MKLHEQLEAINAGMPAEDIARDGQDPAFLKRMAKTYKARQAKRKPKCKRPSTLQPRPSKRKVPASNVLRGSYFEQEDIRHAATAERLKQVNKGKLDDAPISVYVGGELQMTIGG